MKQKSLAQIVLDEFFKKNEKRFGIIVSINDPSSIMVKFSDELARTETFNSMILSFSSIEEGLEKLGTAYREMTIIITLSERKRDDYEQWRKGATIDVSPELIIKSPFV